MQPFTVLTAIAAPLPWADVNTDDICPAPGASSVARKPGGRDILRDRSRMGLNAFAAYRWDDNGDPNPDFVLNQEPFDRAQILISGENFGCGSSREMAVWCLIGIGIRCIIAPSFGDIFHNNCVRNSLLPVRLAPETVHRLTTTATARPGAPFTVDLVEQVVVDPDGATVAFAMGEYQRHLLLSGLDETAATLTRLERIEAHEAAYTAERPWLDGAQI